MYKLNVMFCNLEKCDSFICNKCEDEILLYDSVLEMVILYI